MLLDFDALSPEHLYAALHEAEPSAFVFAAVAFSADGTHLLRSSTGTGLSAHAFAPTRQSKSR